MHIDNQDKTTTNWLKEAQKGYIRMGILILLNKKPAHGYEIMKQIKNRTKGFWSPTPGGVYPILRSLENSHYIKGKWSTQNNRKIRTYSITESGKIILRKALVKQGEITENISSLFKEFSVDVLNIHPSSFTMPAMPLPLSAFLEDEKDLDIEALEKQKETILKSLKMQQERIDLINKLISEKRKAALQS
jgi:DNA-binding PadR family transcriptional regulator